jgi:hypothetical protein
MVLQVGGWARGKQFTIKKFIMNCYKWLRDWQVPVNCDEYSGSIKGFRDYQIINKLSRQRLWCGMIQ